MKHLALGTLLVALGLWGLFAWWESFGLVMRALVPLALLILGLLAVLSSYYRLGAADTADQHSEEKLDH